MVLDYYLVYQFIRRLATPFGEWDAYKLGIIDENGNVLKKRRQLRSREEKRAFGAFDVLILNLKKMLGKVPGGKTRLASYAAALFLLREWNHFTPNSMLTESVSDTDIQKTVKLFLDGYTDYILPEESVNQKMHDLDNLFEQKFDEEAPTVSVASGGVAGLTKDSLPGVTRKQQEKHKKRNKMLRRFSAFKEDLEVKRAQERRDKKHTRPTKPGTMAASVPTDRIT